MAKEKSKMKYRVKGGTHLGNIDPENPGTDLPIFVKDDIIESDLELDKMFVNKFERVEEGADTKAKGAVTRPVAPLPNAARISEGKKMVPRASSLNRAGLKLGNAAGTTSPIDENTDDVVYVDEEGKSPEPEESKHIRDTGEEKEEEEKATPKKAAKPAGTVSAPTASGPRIEGKPGTTPQRSAESRTAPAAEPTSQRAAAGAKSKLGDDVSSDFPAAEKGGMQVFQSGDGYFVADEDEPNRPLHKRPFSTKAEVAAFLKKQK